MLCARLSTRRIATGAALSFVVLGCDGEIRFAALDVGDASTIPGGPCAREEDCPSPLHCDPASGTCLRCAVDAHCAATTPRCDLAQHACVECIAPADCVAPNTTCDATSRRCLTRCTAPGGCPSVTPVCDDSRGVCIGCVRDAQCVGRGARARCELAAGRCVECLADDDCKAVGNPRCDVATGDCSK